MASTAATSSTKNTISFITSKHIEFGKKACAFLTAATDPFHAVAAVEQRLLDNNFTKLQYTKPFFSINNNNNTTNNNNNVLQPGGKYYYIVHHTTVVAFSIGERYKNDGTCGFHIIGGHTDSPNLSVKPNSKKAPAKADTTQLAVSCYGGGLWHTWFDRDLSISGQVLVRENNNNTKTIHSKLVNIKDPVARVSTLCIHLQSDTERQAFAVNKEDHTSPIIAMKNTTLSPQDTDSTDAATTKSTIEQAVSDQINTATTSIDEVTTTTTTNYDDSWINGQEPILLQRIAKELQLDSVKQIADFQLNLYDSQGATLGGMNTEFLYSARLDNLATVFTATEALIDFTTSSSSNNNSNFEQSQDIAMIAFFDHEEVGSVSLNGAGSPIVQEAVQRITSALLPSSSTSTSTISNSELYATTIANSFCLSVDMAHAVHPNYAGKHDSNHAPIMNRGLVIKTNANQRYATNRYNALTVREISKKVNVPIQEFAVRNDCPCGSTIGPTISALTGIRTVDAGMPQLSMHSCREVMGIVDLSYGYDLFKGYFTYFRDVDATIDPSE